MKTAFLIKILLKIKQSKIIFNSGVLGFWGFGVLGFRV